MEKIVNEIVDYIDLHGLTIKEVIRELEVEVMLAYVRKRTMTMCVSPKITIISTPYMKKDSILSYLHGVDFQPPQPYQIKNLHDLEHDDIKHDKDDAPAGMSPSYHHLLQKTRKKRK